MLVAEILKDKGDAVYAIGPDMPLGDAWTVSGIASMPVGESFSVFGRLGVSAVEGKVRYGDFKDSNTTTRAVIGAGVGYAFTPKVAGRVEFQKTGSGIRNLSAGVAYQF